MTIQTIRFVIITVPQGLAFRRFSNMIQMVKEVGETYTAASYPPHVTLRTGAIVPVNEIDQFIQNFANHIGEWTSFEMETEGIASESFVENDQQKYFIYCRIKENPLLVELNSHLLTYKPFIKSNKTSFHPHLSLAYDDLADVGYKKVSNLIESKKSLFPDSIKWTCDNISLYYRQNGKWLPYHVFYSKDSIENRVS